MRSYDFSHGSGYDPECITFARWLHARGISWSGTPSELISELSSADVARPPFSDVGELLVFIELNTQTLWELGIEAAVQKRAGRPRQITLQSTAAEDPELPASDGEGSEPLQETQLFANATHFDSAELPSPEGSPNQQILGVPPPMSLESEDVSSAADIKLQPEEWVTSGAIAEPSSSNDVGEGHPTSELSALDEPDDALQKRSLLIAAALLLVAVAALLFALSKRSTGILAYSKTDQRATTPNVLSEQRPPQSNPVAQDSSGVRPSDYPDANGTTTGSETPDRTVAAETRLQDLNFEDLYREASQGTSPSSERELAMRYAEGRGIKRDRVAAYIWLILARSDGDTENDEMLRQLGAKLSQLELQKVRISIGDSYEHGVGVPRDLVSAHSWFALAEVAGSADATLRKKALEGSMTQEQIQQAESRTTEWLTRHSARSPESQDSVAR